MGCGFVLGKRQFAIGGGEFFQVGELRRLIDFDAVGVGQGQLFEMIAVFFDRGNRRIKMAFGREALRHARFARRTGLAVEAADKFVAADEGMQHRFARHAAGHGGEKMRTPPGIGFARKEIAVGVLEEGFVGGCGEKFIHLDGSVGTESRKGSTCEGYWEACSALTPLSRRRERGDRLCAITLTSRFIS